MPTVTYMPNQRPSLSGAAPTRSVPRRRTAAEAACQSATAITAEILGERRTDHLTRHARVLTKALAAMGIGSTPGEAVALPRRPRQLADITLSHRELQVLAGISQGKSNAIIGRELLISEDTVKTHTRRIFRKLSANDRAHAAVIGLRRGLIN